MISKWIGKQLIYDMKQVEVLTYGMQILLESLCEVIIIICLSLNLGIAETTLTAFFAYAIFRTLGGGAHLKTFQRCLTVGVILMIGIGAIGTYVIPDKLFSILFTLTGLLAIICIIFWIPAGTEKKKISEPIVRKKQKIKYMFLLLIWALVVIYFYQVRAVAVQQALVYGPLAALVFITPAGYKIMSTIDHGLDLLSRKEVLSDEE